MFDPYCQQMIEGTPLGRQFAKLLAEKYHNFIMDDPRVEEARKHNWRRPNEESPIPTVQIWLGDKERGERIVRIIQTDPRGRSKFVDYSDDCMPPAEDVPLPENIRWLADWTGGNHPPIPSSHSSQQGAPSSSSGLARGPDQPPPPPPTSQGRGPDQPPRPHRQHERRLQHKMTSSETFDAQ